MRRRRATRCGARRRDHVHVGNDGTAEGRDAQQRHVPGRGANGGPRRRCPARRRALPLGAPLPHRRRPGRDALSPARRLVRPRGALQRNGVLGPGETLRRDPDSLSRRGARAPHEATGASRRRGEPRADRMGRGGLSRAVAPLRAALRRAHPRVLRPHGRRELHHRQSRRKGRICRYGDRGFRGADRGRRRRTGSRWSAPERSSSASGHRVFS